MAHFYVGKPGLLSLVQDQGRKGYQAFGVPIGGAMDGYAARLANWLVGNPPHSPVLEITLMGPVLTWEANCQIALTGADLSPELDGQSLPLHERIEVKAGATLRFGRCQSGCRAYLAIGGEWDIPSWLGSHSAAHPNASQITPQSILRKGQEISFTPSQTTIPRRLPSAFLFPVEDRPSIRVLPGPEYDQIHPLSIGYFFSQGYRISPDSNRMGYRLQGRKLEWINANSQISSGVMPGTLQVTRDGHPILLMADAQTTGGYPRFLQVIEADRDKLGQLKPGDSLQFELIDREKALALLKQRKDLEEKLWGKSLS